MELPNFKTKEDENDFYKIRVESLGLSRRTQNALVNASIRSVGGILRKTELSLLEIDGLGVNSVEEIKRKIKDCEYLINKEEEKPTIVSATEDFSFPEEKKVPILKTKEEKIEFYKTRVEALGFSARTQKALIELNNNVILSEEEEKKEKETFPEIVTEKPVVTDDHLLNDSLKELENVLESKKIDYIVNFLANHFNLDKEIIKSETRKKEIVEVRNLIIYLLRKYCDLSFPEIGRFFKKDHTTAIYSFNKIKKDNLYIKNIEKDYSSLISELSSIKDKRDNFKLEYTLKKKELKAKKPELGFRRNGHRLKEIPERSMKAFELYKKGITLEKLGESFGVTRERVRQIIKGVVMQIADNEYVSNGIIIDVDTVLEEEKKNRNDLKKSNRPIKPPKPIKVKKWSQNYSACIMCGTVSVHHFLRGLCENCGRKSIEGELRESMIVEHNSKCDCCGIEREGARIAYGKDFFLSRIDKSVLCQKCHSFKAGKNLGVVKKNKWKMFYK